MRPTPLGLTVLEPESGLQVVLEYGVFTISGSTSGCDLLLRADNEARLHDLRDTLNLYFENSGLREHLNWAADRTGTRPANLTIAHIENVRRISPSFFRVRLDGDFRRFEKDGLHFRLLFGPEGADWPMADATGSTIWPGGIDAWHRPPYTVRAIDPECRWIDMDIFIHEGGRVTDWVKQVTPGEEIAMTGPGGAKPRRAGWVGYVGDETALPVIARALETLPDAARGQARIFIPQEADRQEIPVPPGVTLEWITRNGQSDPLSALRELAPPDGDRFVFFAGEREDAKAARAHLEGLGFARTEFTTAAYWTDGWVPPADQARPQIRRN